MIDVISTNLPAALPALHSAAAATAAATGTPKITLATAVIAVRWLHLEAPTLVRFWAKVGGWQGLRSFAKNGKIGGSTTGQPPYQEAQKIPLNSSLGN